MKFSPVQNTQGVTLVECSLLVSLAAVVLIASVLSLKDNLHQDFNRVGDLIAKGHRPSNAPIVMEIPGYTAPVAPKPKPPINVTPPMPHFG